MKTVFRIMLILLFTKFSAFCYASGENDTISTPENVLIISQVCDEINMYYTAIDMNNNEMIIMIFRNGGFLRDPESFRLRKVVRTGIKVDPEKQMKFPVLLRGSNEKNE
ncbi:MAG: hypothetical protein ACM3PT_08625 [Deltaproteobacteria bacterium]